MAESSARIGSGKVNLANRNAPLRVLGRSLTRSDGVRLAERRFSKFSESKSVKSSVGPMGIERRAFLIQKINMSGSTEQPIRIQPKGYLSTRKVMPPEIRTVAAVMRRARTRGLVKRRF